VYSSAGQAGSLGIINAKLLLLQADTKLMHRDALFMACRITR